MKAKSSRQFQIESLNNHKVKKNWRFYTLPKIILIILLIDLIWEIVRTYMCQEIFPWNISLFGINTAAALCGVFSSLLFAREQFATTVKPNLSWSTHYGDFESCKERMWIINLMNAGPGTAIVESILFSYELEDKSKSVSGKTISISELVEMLSQFNLKEGQDFYCKLITKGFPLPPVKKHDEGITCVAFQTSLIRKFKKLDIHFSASDIVGDIHFKSLPVLAALPDNFNELGSSNNIILNLTK